MALSPHGANRAEPELKTKGRLVIMVAAQARSKQFLKISKNHFVFSRIALFSNSDVGDFFVPSTSPFFILEDHP